jgi:hypothetical protein
MCLFKFPNFRCIPICIPAALFLLPPFLFPPSGWSQRQVSAAYHGERMWAIVPMVGGGKSLQDPRRPMFVPAPDAAAGAASNVLDDNHISGFRFVESDDRKFALVEFEARNAKAFRPILESKHPDVKTFERNKATAAEIEREFRRYRTGFDAQAFLGGGR